MTYLYDPCFLQSSTDTWKLSRSCVGVSPHASPAATSEPEDEPASGVEGVSSPTCCSTSAALGTEHRAA